MFFVLEDDGCVHVYESAAAAALEIEALDAGDCIRRAFDDEARPYRVEWLKANKSGRWLWIVPWVENGQYRLVLAGPPDATAFLGMFEDSRPVFAKDIGAVDALRERMRGVPERAPEGKTPP